MLSNVWKCWKYQKNGKGMWWNVIKCHQKCDQMLDLKCDQMWLKMLENVIECHQMSKNVGKCDWNVRKRFPDNESIQVLMSSIGDRRTPGNSERSVFKSLSRIP